jgi:hypothetical protein
MLTGEKISDRYTRIRGMEKIVRVTRYRGVEKMEKVFRL